MPAIIIFGIALRRRMWTFVLAAELRLRRSVCSNLGIHNLLPDEPFLIGCAPEAGRQRSEITLMFGAMARPDSSLDLGWARGFVSLPHDL